MKSFLTLTSLFLRQLIKSKALWIIALVFAGMFIFNFFIQSQITSALNGGMNYDIVTQKATSALKSFAEQIRFYSVLLIVIISALLAPESRKNGTTQFVLSLSVSRLKLAMAQFLALSIFTVISVLIIHAGYAIAAYKVGITSMTEILFSWVSLLLPLLIYSAIIFFMSLSCSAIETYIIFLAIPFVVIRFLEYGQQELSDFLPMFIVRIVQNLKLLYPNINDLMFWPNIFPIINSTDPPFPDWTWTIVHTILSFFFWILLGLWFYQNHDFGSRTATK